MNKKSFNCVRVSSSALQHNYTLVKNLAGPDVPVMAMVKADAYGHGMVRAAQAFAQAGCVVFGVAELREAVILREAGIKGAIYVTLGFLSEDVELIFRYNLIPVIYTYETTRLLADTAMALGQEVGVHIKIDSGMSRLGLLPGELPAFLACIESLPGIRVAGMMSHFPEADISGSASTVRGFQIFSEVCRDLKSRFGGICHIANSGAVLNFPASFCDIVRSGIALYGYHPAGRNAGDQQNAVNLVPAMSFVTTIVQVKTLPAGTGISYGHTYRAEQPITLAVLPVGYEDGFSRLFSNRGQVLIHGRRVPVRGRVCMNMCMVDVTGIEDVRAGDEVVLMGRQGNESISAEDLAEWMTSISYEVLCLLGNNNQREYIE
ncbi:MAG: alanine racemase [Proteobacteria bacterium]|nr:alanine racemase [Pseudomonadota bacterium]